MNKTEFEDKYPELALQPIKKDQRFGYTVNVKKLKRASGKRKAYPHKIGFKKQ